jgi:hypothetical protein
LGKRVCEHAPQAGDERIQASVGRMQTVIEHARTIRERAGRPLKLPLRALTVVAADKGFLADLDGDLRAYVLEEARMHPLRVLIWHLCSFTCWRRRAEGSPPCVS